LNYPHHAALDGPNWDFQTDFLSEMDACNWNDNLPVKLPTGHITFVPAGAYCHATTGDIVALHLGTFALFIHLLLSVDKY